MKDTLDRYHEHKGIARQAQEGLVYDRNTPQGFLSVKVGFRSYRFATGCGCGHLHLVADGGAILNACGGDCSAHQYEPRRTTVATYCDPVRELNKLWKHLEGEHNRRCKDPFACYDERGCNAAIMDAFVAEVEKFKKEHANP